MEARGTSPRGLSDNIKMRIKLMATGLLAALAAWGQSEYTFSDGGRKVSFQLAADEVYSRDGGGVQAARGSSEWGSGRVFTLRSATELKSIRTSRAAASRSLAPVFYDKGSLPSADQLAALPEAARALRMVNARRVMTSKLLVHMDESDWSKLAATKPSAHEKSLLDGWMLVTYPDAFAALDAADSLTKQGTWEFTPVFSRMMSKKQALVREVNDPLYPKQWHLAATGMNLSMKNSWDLATGKGINMTIVDDGLEIKHEDLSPNAYPLDSGYHFNFNGGDEKDPSPGAAKDNHGTNCAGLAAAAGFNNIGVIGVAPEVRLMGLRLIAGDTADDASARALAWQPKDLITHVSSNSWGPVDDGKVDGRVSALQLAGMEKGTKENRDGLGTVYAVSCGNGRGEGDDASYDEFSSSRFAIAVGAVNRDGEQSSYSESGLSVAISALGGEFQPPAVTWTTNNSGEAAFGIKKEKFPSTEAPIDYTDAMNGTSAAAPQVSGAAALLLQLNPKLGYRDVKEILMKTANRVGLVKGEPFFANKGGFTFSRSFGAGLLNVSAALAFAPGWTNLGPIVSAEGAIAEGGAITGEFLFGNIELPNANIRLEHVELIVTVKHPKRGEVGFLIESPSGTQTLAEVRPNDDNADFTDYTFTSPHFWGEGAAGTWKAGVVDIVDNDKNGRLVSAKLRIYGTAK